MLCHNAGAMCFRNHNGNVAAIEIEIVPVFLVTLTEVPCHNIESAPVFYETILELLCHNKNFPKSFTVFFRNNNRSAVPRGRSDLWGIAILFMQADEGKIKKDFYIYIQVAIAVPYSQRDKTCYNSPSGFDWDTLFGRR